ncbi:MAG: hypothetical protein IPK07_05235 [Deltaproteobacteria bacterium]|nr:hypothetical protein [Deltaproteobacteria bacterium]
MGNDALAVERSSVALAPSPVRRLGELFVDRGLVTPVHVDRALWYQHNAGGRIGAALIELGHLGEPDFLRVVAPMIGARAIEVDPRTIDPRVARILPPKVARHMSAVAVAVRDERLIVAMADPAAPRAVERLEAAVGMRIETGLATDPAIERALARLYAYEEAPVVKPADAAEAVVVAARGPESTARALDRLLGGWIRDALHAGASELVIERQPLHLVVRCELGGSGFGAAAPRCALPPPARRSAQTGGRPGVARGARLDAARAARGALPRRDVRGVALDRPHRLRSRCAHRPERCGSVGPGGRAGR